MNKTYTRGLLIEGKADAGLFQANCVLIRRRGWLCSIYTLELEERGNSESGPLGLDEEMVFWGTYDTAHDAAPDRALSPPSAEQLADWVNYINRTEKALA